MDNPSPPLALLRGAAAVLPRPVLARLSRLVVRGLDRTHPKLLANLARLEPALIHIVPHDLPYRFALRVGSEPFTLEIVDRHATGADAEVSASVATLVDLLEGRIDSDTLFFRRDLTISGNTAVIVGLRNVVDREEVNLFNELATLAGPFASPARAVARRLDHALDGFGARVAAMHRTLHPATDQAQDPAAELQKLGGAKVIIATVTNGDAMSAVTGGLAINGTMLLIGAAQAITVSPIFLLMGRRSVKGWYSGTAADSQDTLKFSVLTGVRSMNEVYPLDKVAEAYERMESGKARFRVVLTTGH